MKGKKHPVTIYELMGADVGATGTQSLLTDIQLRPWSATAPTTGKKRRENLATILVNYPDDGPTQVLLQRCLEFMDEPPPPEWDGVYVALSK